jgi:hypothetical protein
MLYQHGTACRTGNNAARNHDRQRKHPPRKNFLYFDTLQPTPKRVRVKRLNRLRHCSGDVIKQWWWR